ncbi:hypothetical protein [Thiomonas sp. FB-Cd]|uniref:hypothetical protein n=1 Tax=Thiomonas sp. FB-Cd TaxID=1158292 RepID=UPI0004DF92B9|nr:hypothetical protein [Thiomonas sp. FB-Cd]
MHIPATIIGFAQAPHAGQSFRGSVDERVAPAFLVQPAPESPQRAHWAQLVSGAVRHAMAAFSNVRAAPRTMV